jgi:DNA recombination protein RmuC
MMGDVGRLRERVLKLQQHFGQANEDMRQILISSEKLEKRGSRIEELDFDEPPAPGVSAVLPSPLARKLQAGE